MVVHVCTKYHSHTYYYQQLVGCYVETGMEGGREGGRGKRCYLYCHGDGSGGAHGRTLLVRG